jgi:hypothetical protein
MDVRSVWGFGGERARVLTVDVASDREKRALAARNFGLSLRAGYNE